MSIIQGKISPWNLPQKLIRQQENSVPLTDAPVNRALHSKAVSSSKLQGRKWEVLSNKPQSIKTLKSQELSAEPQTQRLIWYKIACVAAAAAVAAFAYARISSFGVPPQSPFKRLDNFSESSPLPNGTTLQEKVFTSSSDQGIANLYKKMTSKNNFDPILNQLILKQDNYLQLHSKSFPVFTFLPLSSTQGTSSALQLYNQHDFNELSTCPKDEDPSIAVRSDPKEKINAAPIGEDGEIGDLGVTRMTFTNEQKFAIGLTVITLTALVVKIAKIYRDAQKFSDSFQKLKTFFKKEINDFFKPQGGLDAFFSSYQSTLENSILAAQREQDIRKDLPKDWLVEENKPSHLLLQNPAAMQNNLDLQKNNRKPVVEHDEIPQIVSVQQSTSEEKASQRLLLKKKIEEIESVLKTQESSTAISRVGIARGALEDAREARGSMFPEYNLSFESIIAPPGVIAHIKEKVINYRVRILKSWERESAKEIAEIESTRQKLNALRDELAKLEK